MLPLDPPGYDYGRTAGRTATLTQQWLYLNVTSKVDKYHVFLKKSKKFNFFYLNLIF